MASHGFGQAPKSTEPLSNEGTTAMDILKEIAAKRDREQIEAARRALLPAPTEEEPARDNV